MSRNKQLFRYLFFDFVSAAIAWGLFYSYRKVYIESIKFGYAVPVDFEPRLILGIILIPLGWMLLYYASGYYREVIRKSRLAELWYTIRITFLGVVLLFFSFILDDTVDSYSNYYESFAVLFSLHFILTYIPRLIITTRITKKIHRGQLGFNTLLIGGNIKAVEIYKEIMGQPHSTGNVISGFINVNNGNGNKLAEFVPQLGELNNIKQIIEENDIEEVIIAVEYSEHDKIEKILDALIDSNVVIKAIPGMYEIFTGKVKMSAIMGTPLIEVSHLLIPSWQENLKHFTDIMLSLLALVITAPLTLFLIIGVKLSSKGPVFYKQERVGKNGKPFTIYKFRSMYMGAETNGPELSSRKDSRITPFGRFMRKSRFDEIPNFFNVLKGDMSLVGPRPERQYFIDQIVERAPQYLQLLKVRPGITSWGQVKYGYAENIDQMIRRMKYDLIYLDNMSLYVDFKIMIYTVLTVIQRKGI
ncbi:MAG: sugar transferase [Bacteroidales bacterium]|nr:sugar transferase [Bacteroidales bacterium]